VQQAIRNLEQTALQIALVVSESDVLIGTVTDGDIRRGLLRGLPLDTRVNEIVHRSPLVAPPQLTRDLVLHLMQVNKVHQVPVVDARGTVVGLHLWDDLLAPRERPNIMVIMAGGEGRRMRPHTEHCPKPLLPVGGKPLLSRIIERAEGEGFHHFVIAIRYLGHMIEEHFGDGSRMGVDIRYIREDAPLATAGALSLLTSRPESPFVVSNGDVLTEIRYGDLLDFHALHSAIGTMAVRLYEWQHPFGVVQTDGVNIVGFEEKPVMRSHVNAGIYALDPSALDHLRFGESCDMPTLFSRLQARGARTIAYPMHEPWLDVGQPADYQRATEDAVASGGPTRTGHHPGAGPGHGKDCDS